ncbi:MAG: hypothetical protein RL514_2662 [Verrucomicrobiota bacterium]|jgi:hypothetical protein
MTVTTQDQLNHILDTVKPAILLPIPLGQKGSRTPGWPQTPMSKMRDAAYLQSLLAGNIGVLLGEPASGLCSIDLDTDEFADEFLALNPKLSGTLRTRGARGCNVWMWVQCEIPPTKFLKHKHLLDEEGKPRKVGEWRATGCQTMIWGRHPSGVDYTWLVDAKPIDIPFSEIIWPPDWTKPGEEARPSPTHVAPGPTPGVAGVNPALALERIILPSGSVGINETAEKLFPVIAASKTIFSREGSIVEVAESGAGIRRLEVVSPHAFRSRIEYFGKFAVWRKRKGGESALEPTVASLDHANSLMATVAASQMLPKIIGLVNCPVLLCDADECRIISGGYDAASGIFVTGGGMPPDVELAEAVSSLKDLFADYRFQTRGDRSRALASLITPALRFGRHLIGNIPVDTMEADASQSGKSYREELRAALYNEVPTLVTQKSGGVGSDDESFNAALLAAHPFIVFDNRRGKFDSTHLEAFVTAPGRFQVRVPYRAGVLVDSSWFVLGLTSNGVEFTPDLANRASIVRILKQAPGYQFQQYAEGDVLAHVRANQAYYLGCVFSVIVAWLLAGKPRTEETRHSFRGWSQVLDWIVQNIFDEAPLMDGHGIAQERVSNTGLSFIRKLALAVEKLGQLGQSLTTTHLYELAMAEGIAVPYMSESDDTAGPKLVGGALGRAFSSGDLVEVEGFQITRKTRKGSTRLGERKFTQKAYTFNRLEQGTQTLPGPAPQ